jgi:hypothetical protein
MPFHPFHGRAQIRLPKLPRFQESNFNFRVGAKGHSKNAPPHLVKPKLSGFSKFSRPATRSRKLRVKSAANLAQIKLFSLALQIYLDTLSAIVAYAMTEVKTALPDVSASDRA